MDIMLDLEEVSGGWVGWIYSLVPDILRVLNRIRTGVQVALGIEIEIRDMVTKSLQS